MLNKWVYFFALIVLFCSCTDKRREGDLQKHLWSIKKVDGKSIYIDTVVSSNFLKGDSLNSQFNFICFKIEFEDSLISDKSKQLQKNKYYEYDAQNNLKLIVNNKDSLSVIFAQPLIKTKINYESIFVFNRPQKFERLELKYDDKVEIISRSYLVKIN
ncbi:MAG: hypothetical protein C0459_15045 [Chitinophaga sp.]|jgi:hypothetical protein|nr:hypothetical protein [Chitinophaga sp.]